MSEAEKQFAAVLQSFLQFVSPPYPALIPSVNSFTFKIFFRDVNDILLLDDWIPESKYAADYKTPLKDWVVKNEVLAPRRLLYVSHHCCFVFEEINLVLIKYPSLMFITRFIGKYHGMSF